MLAVIIVAIVIILIIAYVISLFNKVKTAAVNVDESFSGVETYLEERFDLLTKVISTANEEAKREIEHITNVTALRSAFTQAGTVEEKVEAGNAIESAMPKLLATFENYPDSNFNAAFRQVQRSIIAIEDKISAARRSYNSSVSMYNKQIVTFPALIIAGMLGFTSKPMFEAAEHKREDIDIESLWAK